MLPLTENMLHTRVTYLQFVILCLLIVATPDCILGLKNVSVTIPTAVRKGENALLVCNYDLEGDPLYSVKWYKGRREFYRYTPKENPAMKTFPVVGINVEKILSNQSHVILSSVQPTISGKFSCEVSADAPSFHTMVVSGELEVVELPTERPTLMGIHSRYRLGDTINGNCTSNYSKPAANLTWTINDIPVQSRDIRIYSPIKFENLESSIVELNFTVQHHHFVRGRLKLKCLARIHDIYEQDIEKYIEEDRPRILASGRSPDVNLFGYDSQADGEMTDQSDFYSTHYKDVPSSASSSSIIRVRHNRRARSKLARTIFSTYVEDPVLTLAERICNLLTTTLTLDGLLFAATFISILASSNLISTIHTIPHYRSYRCKNINHHIRHHHHHHPSHQQRDECEEEEQQQEQQQRQLAAKQGERNQQQQQQEQDCFHRHHHQPMKNEKDCCVIKPHDSANNCQCIIINNNTLNCISYRNNNTQQLYTRKHVIQKQMIVTS